MRYLLIAVIALAACGDESPAGPGSSGGAGTSGTAGTGQMMSGGAGTGSAGTGDINQLDIDGPGCYPWPQCPAGVQETSDGPIGKPAIFSPTCEARLCAACIDADRKHVDGCYVLRAPTLRMYCNNQDGLAAGTECNWAPK
jgi:hypothetical protein